MRCVNQRSVMPTVVVKPGRCVLYVVVPGVRVC